MKRKSEREKEEERSVGGREQIYGGKDIESKTRFLFVYLYLHAPHIHIQISIHRQIDRL